MTDLTRRRFLKFIGFGALATVVPVSKTVKAGPLTGRDRIPVEDVSIESRKIEFNPNFEYGRATGCNGPEDNFVLRRLHRDAKRILPRGIPYELRLLIPSFVECPERKPAVAWYYSPSMLRDPPKGLTSKSWKYFPEYGCYVMGMFYA
jgi:hypothetical protein